MTAYRNHIALAALAGVALTCSVAPVQADEQAIIDGIQAFFKAQDTAARVDIARRIEADPAYERGKVRQWLHQADLFERLDPGRHEIHVSLTNGQTRTVVLRIPEGYDHHQSWPLIYALHGSGGRGDQIIGYVRHILGVDAERYVIAAPDSYEDVIIHHRHWPPVGEHPAVLLAIKQTVHVDSDRVYLLGYSRGGHTAWTVAVLHADQFAAAMPLAGTFTIFLEDELWPPFMPNLKNLPVYNIWGRNDIYYENGQVSPDGGIAGVNRKFRDLAAEQNLPLTSIELPDAGHSDVEPPPQALAEFLSRRRVQYPQKVEHVFRHPYQASAYWLEGHAWTGKQWTENRINIRLREGESQFNDEDVDQAVARAYRALLGKLEGELNGQELRVSRRKIKELTIWIGDGMIDWRQPVKVYLGGRKPAFEGKLEPSLYVCLSQAARTWDLDRLRWAGLRARRSRAEPVSPETVFPTLAELVAEKKDEHGRGSRQR